MAATLGSPFCVYHLGKPGRDQVAERQTRMNFLGDLALDTLEQIMRFGRRDEDRAAAAKAIIARTMPVTGPNAIQINVGGSAEDPQVAASKIVWQRLRDRKAADEARHALIGGAVDPAPYLAAANDETIIDAEIILEPEPVAAQPIPEQPPAPDTETVAPEPVSEPDPLPPAAVTEPPSMGPQTARVLPEGSWWVIPPSLGVPGQHARHVDERAALLAMPHPHTIPRHAY